MTAGIGGTGPYSQLRTLQFYIKCLKRDLANKPMGVRKKKELTKELASLQLQLKELNQKIREEKQRKRKE